MVITRLKILTECICNDRYTGYGDSFKFDGVFKDTTELDAWRRRATHIVAMDATLFHTSEVGLNSLHTI